MGLLSFLLPIFRRVVVIVFYSGYLVVVRFVYRIVRLVPYHEAG